MTDTDPNGAVDAATPEVDPELVKAAEVIGALSENESAPFDIEEIIERSLANEDRGLLDRTKDAARGLELYFGDQPTATWVLLAASSGSPNMDGFDLLQDVPDEEVRQRLEYALRRLAGLYGEELNRGLNVASRPAEDWQYLDIATRFEMEKGTWFMDVEFDRFDGQKVQIRGDGLSMLRIINRLLEKLNAIGQLTEDYPSLLPDRDDVDRFVMEAQDLIMGLGLLNLEEAADGQVVTP